ncbi:MAG: dipeptidase [Spirochaetales bacterium]|nr:dipeptidase [Spirochaetales bacterium]
MTETGSSQWRELHSDALVIDTHADSIVAYVMRGNLSFFGGQRTPPWKGTIEFLRGTGGRRPGAANIQLNAGTMKEGGIDAGFFAVDVTIPRKNSLAYALDGFGYLLDDFAEANREAAIIKSSTDIVKAKEHGVPAVLMAIENADCTEGSLNVLGMLYRLGVRSIGLTHNVSSVAADGCMEARDGVGLTRFGEKLIQAMNELGMLVDLAHVSPGGFYHALEVSSKPVAFSHGNCRSLCDHPRNLDDRQLKALSENGGFIGMSYVPFFIDAKDPTIARLVDHIDHAVEVAGIDVVGLGSDFDGGGTLLEDATQVPLITEGLAKRGYKPADIRKILGENVFRVLKATIG